jgi:Dockerin type I domain
MQMRDNNPHDQDEGLEAPPQLVSALKHLPQEPIFIPPTADEAILRAARRHLTQPGKVRRGWLGWFRFMPWVAGAAAAILLVATIPQFFKHPAPGPARDSAFARGDLNHDGRVDILDAFALARQLKLSGTRNLQLDVNGDGVVDGRDVAALAARAVKLEQGGHS